MKRIEGVYRYWRLVNCGGYTIAYRRKITPTDGRKKTITQFADSLNGIWDTEPIEYDDAFFMYKDDGRISCRVAMSVETAERKRLDSQRVSPSYNTKKLSI